MPSAWTAVSLGWDANTSCNSWSTGAWENEKMKTLMKKAAQPLHQCFIEVCGSLGLDFKSWALHPAYSILGLSFPHENSAFSILQQEMHLCRSE